MVFQILKNKFDDLKHRVELGAERFNQCEEYAKKLINNNSPYVDDIEARQEQLRYIIRATCTTNANFTN